MRAHSGMHVPTIRNNHLRTKSDLSGLSVHCDTIAFAALESISACLTIIKLVCSYHSHTSHSQHSRI